MTEEPLDKTQVDALVAAVHERDRRPPPEQVTPPVVVVVVKEEEEGTSLPTSWTTAPPWAYPISSARPVPHDSHAVPFLAYDLSPAYAPLPPATAVPSFPSPTSPPGDPYASVEASPRYPGPALYYPMPGEGNAFDPNLQRLPRYASGYTLPLPPVEAYLPSPPLDVALLHPRARDYAPAVPPAPAHSGHGAIGQPVPWQSPPRLPSGLSYPISSSSSSTTPALVGHPRVSAAHDGRTRPSGTTTTSRGRPVHEHGSPNWSVLRQQIQAGEHPRSRGTCKFFNPQTVSVFPS